MSVAIEQIKRDIDNLSDTVYRIYEYRHDERRQEAIPETYEQNAPRQNDIGLNSE